MNGKSSSYYGIRINSDIQEKLQILHPSLGDERASDPTFCAHVYTREMNFTNLPIRAAWFNVIILSTGISVRMKWSDQFVYPVNFMASSYPVELESIFAVRQY